jgi:hypothetical protein
LVRRATIALQFATLLFAALGPVGCGDRAPTAMPADHDVFVRYDADGPRDGSPLRARVRCGDGDGGPVCVALANVPRYTLRPVPPTRACTMIYAGPQTARVTGTIDGRAVDARISRRNGCEEARYQAVVPLLRALFDGRVTSTPQR